jgi:hypothetical protein
MKKNNNQKLAKRILNITLSIELIDNMFSQQTRLSKRRVFKRPSLLKNAGFRMHLAINSRIGGMSVKLGALRSRHFIITSSPSRTDICQTRNL